MNVLSRSVALVAFVAACSARTVAPPAPDRSPVVARVDGDAITADEVSHRAQAEHLSAGDALQRCIRDRLLVREGTRRGLVNDDDAENARWHASVQLLIAREVEDKESPATIAPSFFEEIFRRRRVEFRHDGLVLIAHALAQVEADAGVGARDEATRTIEAFRARLLATAGPRPTQAQFEGLAEQMHLHHEALPGFDRTGQAPDGTTFESAFVQSAWTLSDTSPVSAPFSTRFGAHVALRLGSVPPLSRPMAEAQAIVVRDGVTLRRARALQRLLEDVRARTDVRVSETAVGAATPAANAPGAAPSTPR